jgi:hypothetical protein
MGAVHTRFSTGTLRRRPQLDDAAVARRPAVDGVRRNAAHALVLAAARSGGPTPVGGWNVVSMARQQGVLEQRPQAVRLLPLVDDGAVHAGPGPVAVQVGGRIEQLLGVPEEDLVERAYLLTMSASKDSPRSCSLNRSAPP